MEDLTRFRNIIREEIEKMLYEIPVKGDFYLFWIDRFGELIEPKGQHKESIYRKPNRFYTQEQIQKIKEDPDLELTDKWKNPYLWKGGVIRGRYDGYGDVKGSRSPEVNYMGSEKAIRDNLDRLILDKGGVEYNVAEMDVETGEIQDTDSGLSLEAFMKRYGGRRKKSKSKVSRFR